MTSAPVMQRVHRARFVFYSPDHRFMHERRGHSPHQGTVIDAEANLATHLQPVCAAIENQVITAGAKDG